MKIHRSFLTSFLSLIFFRSVHRPVLVAEFQSNSVALHLQKFCAMLLFIKPALVHAALYFFSPWVFSLISLVATPDFILVMYLGSSTTAYFRG